MTTLKDLYAKLTPKRRLKIYAVAAIVGAWFVARGLIMADDLRAVLEVLGIGLGVVAVPSLAAANTPKEDE